jgi:hypothetical protein
MAGISMAAMHTHADNVNAHRFTSDLTPISFRILILVSLAALMRVDDSRPPTDEYKNGMNAARSVMKAAGK